MPLPTDAASPAPFRVLVSGALGLMPAIDALRAQGVEVIASDRDAAALAGAAAAREGLRCVPADLDLTLDAHRLAVAARRAGCDVLVHHMGGGAGPVPASENGAAAFMRAMRLIHAVRPRMRGGRGGRLILTGCPDDCARSLRIVFDRAGAFAARTGLTVAQCTVDEVAAMVRAERAATGPGPAPEVPPAKTVALAG